MLIIVVITALREFKGRNQQNQNEATVMGKAVAIRDGRLQEIPIEQLVVGDVVQISGQCELSADGLLIQVCSL